MITAKVVCAGQRRLTEVTTVNRQEQISGSIRTDALDLGLLEDVITETEGRLGLLPDDGGDDDGNGPPEIVIQFVITGLDDDEAPDLIEEEPEPEPTRTTGGWLWALIGAALGLSIG